MASAVPKLPQDRVNRAVKTRGEWQAATGFGWQHGAVPEPPPRLLKASRDAWTAWMQSWVASHWEPMDLPGLHHLILLYDLIQRGETRNAPELRQMMDSYGITKKGQQDRRWLPPKDDLPATDEDTPAPYGSLKVVV